MAKRKRKTQLDLAIEGIDRDIAHAEAALAVLHATRVRLASHLTPTKPEVDATDLRSVEEQATAPLRFGG